MGGVRLAGQFDDLAKSILAGGGITAADVKTLRHGVFADGVVDRDEADLIFYLDAQGGDNDDAWIAFFVDALSNYFIWQQYPRGVLGEEDGAYLVERITHDGRVGHLGEFALLVNIIFRAHQSPEAVILLALEALEESVLEGSGKLFGKGRRRPGVIDEDEVEVIRKVVYGSGGGGNLRITRREAELLFRLNNQTVGKKNAHGWRELFVTAVGNYLMHPKGPPKVVDAEAARERDARWAEIGERSIMAGMFSKRAFTVWSDERRRQEEEHQRKLEEVEAEVEREAVDRAEVEWLIERIEEDDVIHDNERALLAYIKEKAVFIDPSLDSYFEKYGV